MNDMRKILILLITIMSNSLLFGCEYLDELSTTTNQDNEITTTTERETLNNRDGAIIIINELINKLDSLQGHSSEMNNQNNAVFLSNNNYEIYERDELLPSSRIGIHYDNEWIDMNRDMLAISKAVLETNEDFQFD